MATQGQYFPQDFSEKSTPIANDLLLLGDSADVDGDGNPKSDKKIKLSSMWAAIFGSRDTDDIPEGTNKYYSDAQVAASAYATATDASLSSLDSLKAAKTNVLGLDNTTSFTPDADYEPATKKYVDDSGQTIASDAEALAGTATDRILNTAQSNKLNTYITAADVSTGTSTFTVVITHGLGRVPDDIELAIKEDNDSSSIGFYKAGSQAYIYQDVTYNESGTNGLGRTQTGSGDFFLVTAGTFTTTQLTLTFTENGNVSDKTLSYLIKIR